MPKVGTFQVGLAIALCLIGGVRGLCQEEAELGFDQQYQRALDLVMPVELPFRSHELADRYDWIFVVRVNPPVGGEALYAVKRPFRGKTRLMVVKAGPRSIRSQLRESVEDAGFSIERFARGAKLTRRELEEEDCPGLAGLAVQLEEAFVPAIPRIGMMLGSTSYEVLVARALSELRFTYWGPGSQAVRQLNDL